MSDFYKGSLSPESMMLLGKALKPLSEAEKQELSKIEKLKKIEDYSEQDVREGIISPILRVLGYNKEGNFSFDCNHSIYVLGKRLEYDYNICLFEENFWIIEAKKPSVTNGKFQYNELAQALEYASHPSINAPLVVLCDGHAIEIFDKEDNLDAPILRVERQNLVRDFDKIRSILSPLQNWFFQKRRIIRQIDKVLENEYNSERLKEFEEIITYNIRKTQNKVWDNYRNLEKKNEIDFSFVQEMNYVDLIEVYLAITNTVKMQKEVSKALVRQCRENSFKVLHYIFPKSPKSLSEAYFPNALHFLMLLEESKVKIGWLPNWLVKDKSENTIQDAIKTLIKLSLTYFNDAEDWKVAILHSSASRRLAKALMILSPNMQDIGKLRHFEERVWGEEFNLSQIMSSPKRHLILELDNLVRKMSMLFVSKNTDKFNRLKLATAKKELQDLWRSEIQLLESVECYFDFEKENSLGEIHPTELSAVVYDSMGHHALCVINEFPKWKEYVLKENIEEIKQLASFGSWKAKQFLDIESGAQYPPIPEIEIANRFFFGDTNTLQRLRSIYRL